MCPSVNPKTNIFPRMLGAVPFASPTSKSANRTSPQLTMEEFSSESANGKIESGMERSSRSPITHHA